MWLNSRGFPAALDESAARRMTAGAAATTASRGRAARHRRRALLVRPARQPRRRRAARDRGRSDRWRFPLAARGRGGGRRLPSRRPRGGRPRPPLPVSGPRVVMLLLDGASLEYISPRVGRRAPAELRAACSTRARRWTWRRSVRRSPDPVWAAVATGMYPSKNGVRSAGRRITSAATTRAVDLLPDHCFSHVLVRLGLLRDEPNSSASLARAAALEHPRRRGRQRRRRALAADLPGAAGARLRRERSVPPAASDRSLEFDRAPRTRTESCPSPERVCRSRRRAGLAAVAGRRGRATARPRRRAGLRDRFYSRAMRDLRARVAGAAVGGALPGPRHRRALLPALHASRATFGDVDATRSAGGGRRCSSATTRYIDGEIGAALARPARPATCCSSCRASAWSRCTPGQAAARPAARRSRLSGTHERAPDGFLLAYGDRRRARPPPARLDRRRHADVLYFLGLPVGRDMDGYARTDLFTRVHRRAADHVHSDATAIGRRVAVGVSSAAVQRVR